MFDLHGDFSLSSLSRGDLNGSVNFKEKSTSSSSASTDSIQHVASSPASFQGKTTPEIVPFTSNSASATSITLDPHQTGIGIQKAPSPTTGRFWGFRDAARSLIGSWALTSNEKRAIENDSEVQRLQEELSNRFGGANAVIPSGNTKSYNKLIQDLTAAQNQALQNYRNTKLLGTPA